MYTFHVLFAVNTDNIDGADTYIPLQKHWLVATFCVFIRKKGRLVFLSPLQFGCNWLLVLGLYKEEYLHIFKCVSFRLHLAFVLSGKLGFRKPV